MCRILAVKNFSYKKHLPVLKEFMSLATAGKVPRGSRPGHLDGWGIGYYLSNNSDGGKTPVVIKSGAPLTLPQEKAGFLETLKTLNKTPILFAHLRKSAWDDISSSHRDGKNSHPFSYKNYLFAHNGTVRNYQKFIPLIPHKLPGEKPLDTEVIFHFIVSQIEEARDTDNLYTAIKKAFDRIPRISPEFSALNSVFSDGKKIWAYRRFTREPDYYTLYLWKDGASTIISSQIISAPLTPRLISDGEMVEI